MRKKGGISVGFTIGIVLAIVGFVLIMFIMGQFDFSRISEDKVCELSILARASAPDAVQGALPLKCSTKKICLTSDKRSKCDSSFEGENPLVVKLPKNELDAVNMIEKINAEALFDCWSLTGEGKFDLFGSYSESRGLDSAKPVCLVCSRIAVDESVDKGVLESVDIREYMEKNSAPGSRLSYLQKMSGDDGLVSSLGIKESVFKNKLDELGEKANIKGDEGNREVAVLFSQIKSTSWGSSLKNLGSDALVIAGGTFFTPVVGSVAKSLFLSRGGIGALSIIVAGTSVNAAYNAYQGRALAAGYCGKFSGNTKDASGEGCSLVNVIPYSVENVNALCPQIEGGI